MLNGGGFDPTTNVANMLTDLTPDTDTAQTAAPVLSSASYNFVAGDVGHWVYIAAGTNWVVGWYKIASVAANKATVDADVGEVVKQDANGNFITNTSVGCATVANPTNGTFAVDYSQGTAYILTSGDFASLIVTPTVVTTAIGGLSKVMIGNHIHFTSGDANVLIGWYRIVNVTDANTMTVDRAMCSADSTGDTGYIGGALSLNSALDDDFHEILIAGNRVCFKYSASAFTFGETVSAVAAGTANGNIIFIGYNSIRSDVPLGINRPTVNCSSAIYSTGNYIQFHNLIFIGTATSVLATSAQTRLFNCKVINTSTTAGRNAIGPISGGVIAVTNCELISLRGQALSIGGTAVAVLNSYIHSSSKGIVNGGGNINVINNIIESCYTSNVEINNGSAIALVLNNTIYGSENTTGIGINLLAGSLLVNVLNNIIYGFVTGITHADASQKHVYCNYNTFNNNDTDVTAVQKGANDIALAPQFTNVAQITGTAGKFDAGGGKLIDTTKNFASLGVVAGRDAVYIISGTGVTAMNYLIDSISTTTNPNDTLNLTPSPGTNTTADKVYQITVGDNFAVGANMKAAGFPGAFQGGYSTGYIDIGAVQRIEPTVSPPSFVGA